MGSTSVRNIILGVSLVLTSACNTIFVVHDADTEVEGNTDGSFCDNVPDDVIICDDFEDEQGVADTQNGQVSWVDDPVFEGTQAMCAQTSAEESWACMAYPFTAVESGTIYFSARFFIPDDTVTGNITLVNLSGQVDEASEQTFGVDINVSALRSMDIYVHGNFTRYASDDDRVPTGRWFCLVGTYSISDVSGEASVWIDDNLVVSTTASEEAVVTGGVSELHVGIGWTEDGQETAVVYVDNLKMGTSPITCD